MESRKGRHLARAALMSAALMLLTVAGHSAGSGSLPPLLGLVVVGCFAFALTFAVSDRRRSLPWLLGYMLAAQALLHVLLTFSAGHAHGGPDVAPTGMIAGHVAGGFAAALVLAYADDLIERWGRLLAHALASPRVLVPVVGGGHTTLLAVVRSSGWREVLLHHVERRGPPELAISPTSS